MLALVVVTPVPAADESDDETVEEIAHIQLDSFMAPIQMQDGSRRPLAITIALQVPEKERVSAVCEVSPRIRDALLRALFENPIPVRDDDTLDLQAVEPALRRATNRTLGGDTVSAVFVSVGAAIGSSGARQKFPFSGLLDCRGSKLSSAAQ